MPPLPLNRIWGYGIALLAVLAATGLRLAVGPVLEERQPFAGFYIALLVISWVGGLGPSVLTLVLGGLSGAFLSALVPSPSSADAADWTALLVYLVVGSAIIAYSEGQRIAQRRRDREAAERQRLAEDLRESEGRFRQLAATIADVFWITDPHLRKVLYVSPSYEVVWGRPCEAVLADFGDWLDGVHPEDRARVIGAFSNMEHTGTYEEQYRVVRPDGTTRWVRTRGFPIRDGSGKVLQVAGIVEDITDRRRADLNARRLKALSDQANDALFILNPDGDILDANGVACEWLGYDRARLLTLGVPDIDPAFECERFRGFVERALRERVPPIEGALRRRDGSLLPVEINSAALRFEGEAYVFAVVRDIAERKRAEEALRDSERHFRQLADTMPQIVWTAEPDGRVDFVNNRWYDYTGMPNEEALDDERWWEAVCPEDRARLGSLRGRAVGEGDLFEAEIRLRRGDGEYRWHLVRSVPIRDREGRVVRRFGTATDIDDRKRAEEDLRAERERIQLVADAVPALIAYIDADARYRLNNRAYETWFSRPSEAFLGKSISEALGEEAWEVLRPHIESCLSGRVESYEARVPYRDGGFRWISATYTPDIGEDGRARGLVAFVNDITERHRREEELRASEGRFRQLAEAMPQIVWVADPSGGIIYLNRHWTEYTGGTVEEGSGAGWLEFVHPEDRPALRASWEASLRTGTLYAGEYRLRGRRGGYHWHVVRGVPVRDGEGRVARWYGSCTEVDDLRRMADTLREADRRKNEFIATLAHELRNPLAPIRSAVQLLRRKGPPDPELVWARDVIDRQVAQMARLLDDLLDVGRFNQSKLELRSARVDLASVIEAAVETSRPAIEQGGHGFSCALPPGLVPLDADPVRLAQVFSNLLNNAAKYTARGGQIRLSAERQGAEVVVSVRDNGIGIDGDHLARVFEMFSQVDSALERTQGGLGIGLSLVKSLVELHGGSVEARSDGPGTGSTFLVRLPIAGLPVESRPATASQSASQTVIPTPDRAGGAAGPRGKARVLLVDDNKDSARTLGRLLQLEGHQVVSVEHDGPAGLEAFDRFRPDACVLDIGLPGMDGFELARRIREHPAGDRATLIALTGWGQQDDRLRSRKAGFDHHLVKPADPDELCKLLDASRLEPDPAGL